MKKTIAGLCGAVLLLPIIWAPPVKAASELEKVTAILAGLARLISVQLGDGSWNVGGYTDGPTGAALYALIGQKSKWPAASAAAYQTAVVNGINYLLADATVVALTTRSDGVKICPGGASSCNGVYWNGQGEQTYSTGLVAPALAAYALMVGPGSVATTTGPLKNLTWTQVLQGMINTFAAAQSTNGATAGGWRYNLPANADSDSSTTQWAVLTFIFGESTGAVTPAATKTLLATWLAKAQAVDGGSAQPATNGAACYDIGGYAGLGCTHSDTGGWELSMTYLGNNVNAAQQSGLTWLNANWKVVPSGTWYGNVGHPYAMWSVYKGLETTIGLTNNTYITNLTTDCGKAGGDLPGSGVCNWWEDYNHYLVKNQNVNGSWTDSQGEWSDPLDTSFFVSILGAVSVPTGNTTGASVPVLSKWGLVTLAILLAGFAAMSLRKPRIV